MRVSRRVFLTGSAAVGAVMATDGNAADRQPMLREESEAWNEVQSAWSAGLIDVRPWAQPMGGGRLGVGWVTASPADGRVEYTQEDAVGASTVWRTAWYAEDGLRQAGGTLQRAVIEGYDPTKPIRLRAVSRPITAFQRNAVTFGPAAVSDVLRLSALEGSDGATSFAVFNDVHSRVQNYPLLLHRAGEGVRFAVLNGDVIQNPQSGDDIAANALLPMAWFAGRGMPCFFGRGNHEMRGATARSLKRRLCLTEDRYYAAMTFGAARVVFLDSGECFPDGHADLNGLADCDAYIEEQRAWLEREIASAAFRSAAWRIVVMHIAPDWRKREAGEDRLISRFAPLFDTGGVTALICGHNHRAELLAFAPPGRAPAAWPVFIGGGPDLASATVIRVDADSRSLKIACIRSDGTAAGERSWSKGAEGV